MWNVQKSQRLGGNSGADRREPEAKSSPKGVSQEHRILFSRDRLN